MHGALGDRRKAARGGAGGPKKGGAGGKFTWGAALAGDEGGERMDRGDPNYDSEADAEVREVVDEEESDEYEPTRSRSKIVQAVMQYKDEVGGGKEGMGERAASLMRSLPGPLSDHDVPARVPGERRHGGDRALHW